MEHWDRFNYRDDVITFLQEQLALQLDFLTPPDFMASVLVFPPDTEYDLEELLQEEDVHA